MRKAILITMMCLVLTGCDGNERKSDSIITYGHSDWTNDDCVITLKDGWFTCGYSIDYEKGQVIIQIEKEK